MYKSYKQSGKELKKLEFKDRAISSLLIIDIVLCILGIGAWIFFEFTHAEAWMASLSCAGSIFLAVSLIPLVCWWFDSDDRIRGAKGEIFPVPGTDED